MSRNTGRNRDKGGRLNRATPRHKSKRASDARAQKGGEPTLCTTAGRAFARGKWGNKSESRRGNCRAVSAEYPSACGPDGCWDRTGALFSTSMKNGIK